MSADLINKLHLMERAALTAVSYLHRVHSGGHKIEAKRKPDHTLVMNLDVECQKRIVEILAPALPVAGEEDETSHHLIGSSQDYFTVDPIDGTASCKS